MKTSKNPFDTENLLGNDNIMRNRKSLIFCWVFIIFFLLATLIIILTSLFWFQTPLEYTDLNDIYTNNTKSYKNDTEIPLDSEKPDFDYPELIEAPVEVKEHQNPFESHRNYKKFIPIEPYIYARQRLQNADVAGLKEFPWFVALFRQNPKNESDLRVFCGGSLIADDLVLTAAHCFRHKIHSLRLGEWNIHSNPDYVVHTDGYKELADPVQVFTANEITVIIHKKYDNSTAFNDIALIRLHRPADLSRNNIKKVGLPFNNPEIPETLIAIGFGLTETNHRTSSVLKLGLVNVIENPKECEKLFENVIGMRKITEKQFCAKGKNKAGKIVMTCNGDSGGPLHQFDPSKDLYIQYGITSWGVSGTVFNVCGDDRAPVVKVKVYSYLKWILDHADDSLV